MLDNKLKGSGNLKKRGIFGRAVSAVLAMASAFTVCASAGSFDAWAAMDYSQFPSGYSYPTEMSGRSAKEIVADMGAGWNLGNQLEAEYNETYWGNPTISKSTIDAMAQKGFTTLRVPVRWDDNYTDYNNFTISSSYMDRVETVVNYGLSNGMYVILNVHHNDLQKWVSYDYWTQQKVKNELTSVWKQIGERFKNYGDKLIFEVNNEPRCDEDWGGNTDYYNIVNEYNETARAAIRSVGGNNSRRLVLLPTYCASADSPKVWGWKNLSNDNMVAVSIHAYKPFDFAYEGNGHNYWTDDDYNELQNMFNDLNSAFISKGIPVVIGEFGATEKGNYEARVKYAGIYASMAKSYGIPCLWWDNNVTGYGGEKFGIYDRNGGYFIYGDIADAIINAYGKGSPNPPTPPTPAPTGDITLFSGKSSAKKWAQAVDITTSKNGGSFDGANINSNGYFYIEYSGKKDSIELIMQSWSGGAQWGKVQISNSGEVNGHYYAEFSYDNCVSAFGTSDFGGKLDKLYAGAGSSSVTVYSMMWKTFGSTPDEPDDGGDPYVSLFWGESGAEPWGQAVSVMTAKNGGSYDASGITKGGYFYVEYSGTEKEVELVLQSWSGGREWAKVNASEYGYANGHYFAKYYYDDCVNAFGTSDFSGRLDQIHAGAAGSYVTVYSVCYCYPN